MNKPVISVVIPTFNSQKYLEEAIESVINQTYSNLQILILDDGSTDNSVSIVKSFADFRIELYESQENKGQSYQLNKGISLAKGEFVCIMHSDDIMYKNKLAKQLVFLQSNPMIGVCGCNVQLIGEKSDLWNFPENNQDCKDLLLSTVPFAHPAVVFRKSVLAQLDSVYNQEMVPVEDYELWVKLANKTYFGNVQDVLLKYRVHPNQIGNIKKTEEEILLKEVRKKIVTQLFNIESQDAALCFKTLYSPDELFHADAVRGLVLLWKANKNCSFFSKPALKGRLKHTLFKIFKRLTLTQRFKYLFNNSALIEISFFKSLARVLITNRHI